ncbi:MAG: efflux RND transporter permease subunit [Peptococcaceae bacterium]|nr:efflux RND transporter permease subunit [Peptococcaceae bacterium]
MKLVDFSVRRPVAVIMAVLAVIVVGAVSFSRLAIDLFPEMEIPVAAVITTYEGAAPQEVERLVTKPLEEALATIENVKEITSISQRGTSIITVGFNWGTDVDFATLDMREKIDYVKRFLPDGVETPMVMKFDPSQMPISIISFTGEQSQEELKRLAEDTVKPRLERIEGVASAAVFGGREREIQVIVDPAALSGYGISLNQVVQALQAQNLDFSAGKVQEGSKDYLVRVVGEFEDLKDIGNITVAVPGGTGARLLDLAEIRDGYKDQDIKGRLDGNPALALIIQKQPTANTVEVSEKVDEVLSALSAELPGNIKFSKVFDQADFIKDSIADLQKDIIQGGLLAAFVIFIFLRSLRSTLVILTAIPIAIIGAANLLYFSGETINIMTLGGLALGVGMIVDDAIVVLENIFRHRQEGYGLIDAATLGASEVGSAVTGATLTSMAVFIPIIFVAGLASELFTPLALTVSFALGASLLVALSLVPMLSARLLANVGRETRSVRGLLGRVLDATGRGLQRLDETYRSILDYSLRHRKKVLLVAAAAFFGSLALIPLVGAEFIPKMDEGMVSVSLQMPKGTSIEKTDEIVTSIEQMALEIPETDSVFTSLGAGSHEERAGFGGGSPDRAMVDIKLKPLSERKRSSEEIASVLRRELQDIPGVEVNIEATGMMTMDTGGPPLQVILKGDNLDTLRELAAKAAEIVAEVPGTVEVESSLEEGRPELNLVVDRDRAAAYGLSVAQIGSAVRAAVQGQVATRYHVSGDEIDVRVRLADDARQNINDLENLILTTPSGGQVLLRDVASVEPGTGPTAIRRQDQSRIAVISGKLEGRDLGSVIADIKERLRDFPLPPGYQFEYSGEAKEMAEAFGNLAVAFVLAVILVYMILAIQFESLFYPFVIMFSVPVSFTGIVLSLLVTGRTFNLPAFIGVIVTVGIVVKNAIVLVDYINILRSRNLSRDEAILKAGPTRLRPILMTAGTTIGAMFPIALGLGEGSEVEAPLGTVVVGGLLLSTLVSLVLVPVVYSIFDDWGQRIMRRFRRRSQEAELRT